VGHFYSRAHDILGSCKAYTEGVQVGCFVKGGIENVNKNKGRCSYKFKADLLEHVKILVKKFERIGVQNVDEGRGNCSPKFKGGLTLGSGLFVGTLVILVGFFFVFGYLSFYYF